MQTASNHAPRPCCHAGCGRLVDNGSYCSEHKALADARRSEQLRKAHKHYNKRRDDSDDFYKSARWRKFRAAYLRIHGLCVDCDSHGFIAEAVILDHIKPYKTHPHLGLDWNNVRPLCRTCHNQIGERVGLLG